MKETEFEVLDADRAERVVVVKAAGLEKRVTVRELLPDDYARTAKTFQMFVKDESAPDKKASFQEMLEAMKEVLGLSLFYEDGHPVPRCEFEVWKISVLQRLFSIALDLNGMTKEAQDQAKKDSGAKTDSGTE